MTTLYYPVVHTDFEAEDGIDTSYDIKEPAKDFATAERRGEETVPYVEIPTQVGPAGADVMRVDYDDKGRHLEHGWDGVLSFDSAIAADAAEDYFGDAILKAHM